MSDRVDTEAVRARIGDWRRGLVGRITDHEVATLCDELDRTREALRACADNLNETGGWGIEALRLTRAALAESGNTEPKVCPTCGGTGWVSRPGAGAWAECDARCPDCEGDE